MAGRRASAEHGYPSDEQLGSQGSRVRGSGDPRTRLAVASCGFDGNQLVLHVVKSHEPGLLGAVFKMKRGGFQYLSAEILPVIGLREDAMSLRSGAVTTFLRVPHFEDNLDAL